MWRCQNLWGCVERWKQDKSQIGGATFQLERILERENLLMVLLTGLNTHLNNLGLTEEITCRFYQEKEKMHGIFWTAVKGCAELQSLRQGYEVWIDRQSWWRYSIQIRAAHKLLKTVTKCRVYYKKIIYFIWQYFKLHICLITSFIWLILI